MYTITEQSPAANYSRLTNHLTLIASAVAAVADWLDGQRHLERFEHQTGCYHVGEANRRRKIKYTIKTAEALSSVLSITESLFDLQSYSND